MFQRSRSNCPLPCLSPYLFILNEVVKGRARNGPAFWCECQSEGTPVDNEIETDRKKTSGDGKIFRGYVRSEVRIDRFAARARGERFPAWERPNADQIFEGFQEYSIDRPSPLREIDGDRKAGETDLPAGYGLLHPGNQRRREAGRVFHHYFRWERGRPRP